ncbi:MAG: tyrosine-type recombinase/integrase [Desulfobulbaceae bacterium]|nr:tyrosine-type recombinase/integrase [Desulfobulbaceae bacterium]
MDEKAVQTATPKNIPVLLTETEDDLHRWSAIYFETQVTTSTRSQKEQKRDLALFLSFMAQEAGNTLRSSWSPRVTKDFLTGLQNTFKEDGSRKWSDRTINRMTAHLKTFAKWIHQHRPFPLGAPMEKIKMLSVGNQLEIERALTKQERNRILDAADQLLLVGGRSRDRHRNGGATPPQRKNFRPYRNRAIIYTLIETGMRRSAIISLNLVDIDFDRRILSVVEKGGSVQPYPISRQGLAAISDYLEQERAGDQEKWQAHALFLSALCNPHGDGRLTPRVINTVWNQVRDFAGVDKDKTPHSARHGMGVFIMEKTGNVAAVQRQLGHKNASFSLQYSRITNDELKRILDER